MGRRVVRLEPELPQMPVHEEVGVEAGAHLPDADTASDVLQQGRSLRSLRVGPADYAQSHVLQTRHEKDNLSQAVKSD